MTVDDWLWRYDLLRAGLRQQGRKTFFEGFFSHGWHRGLATVHASGVQNHAFNYRFTNSCESELRRSMDKVDEMDERDGTDEDRAAIAGACRTVALNSFYFAMISKPKTPPRAAVPHDF